MYKKRNNAEEEPENPLSLSFLDALSCGLAATLALFLIFVVLPHGEMAKEAAGRVQGDDSQEALSGFRSRFLKATPENAPLAVYIYTSDSDKLEHNDISWECPKADWFPFFTKLEDEKEYIFGGFTLAPSLKAQRIHLRSKKRIDSLTVNLIGAVTSTVELRLITKRNENKDETNVLTIDRTKKDGWIIPDDGYEIVPEKKAEANNE